MTLLGEPDELIDDVQSLARAAVAHIDLSTHDGVHPRFGVVDVLPFVPLGSATLALAVELRDRSATWLADALGVPCFLYGPLLDGSVRTLPDVRRGAFRTLNPDIGPTHAHPTAGATAVGAREVLVAWNIWLDGVSLTEAKQLAAQVRDIDVRALGLEVAGAVQVSCNLVNPVRTTPADVHDAVAGALADGASIRRCELVGLAPAAVLREVRADRWAQLDLDQRSTIEAHAEARSLSIR